MPPAKKPKRHAKHQTWTRGWETSFKKAFDSIFDPSVERLNAVLDGRLASTTYYGVVAILHDMALAHASTLTGTRKPARGQQATKK
jgi:hypothetical protein